MPRSSGDLPRGTSLLPEGMNVEKRVSDDDTWNVADTADIWSHAGLRRDDAIVMIMMVRNHHPSPGNLGTLGNKTWLL